MELGDYSQLYSSTPASSIGGAFGRTWLGSALGYSSVAEAEDWTRQEQSSNNALARDLFKLDRQNAFNSLESQRQRDFEADMSNTAWQRAVKDMKAAGINPALAYSQGGSSTPSGSSASSGSGSASRGSSSPRRDNGSSTVAAIMNVVSGFYQSSSKLASTAISALI